MVSHDKVDMGRFKTPSLRDVVNTGPWMHDGSKSSLKEILIIYNEGGLSGSDPLVKRIGLNRSETDDLIAFLGAISTAPAEFKKPVLPD